MIINKEFLDNNFLNNLLALEKYFPNLFDFFKAYKEERYYLIYDSEGGYNIHDAVLEVNLYEKNPLEVCAENLKAYQNDPIFFSKLQGSISETSAKVNPVHSDSVRKMAGLSYNLHSITNSELSFFDRIKSMLFVGVGAGHDLEYIVENKNINNLIIIEPNADIFYASLFLVDWASIFDKYSAENKNISIIIDSDNSNLANDFYKSTVENGHHFANALFLYCPIHLEGYDELLKEVSDVVRGRLLSGYGFYDDSRLSVAATISNVKNNIPLYVKSNRLHDIIDDSRHPVFIIGNGPSLDKDLAFIKKNQDKAIIISCGSGVKPLERHNIVPDFHFECERTAFTKYWLDQVDPKFLKKTNFIGLNLVYPETYELFNKVGMMAKSSETGSFMLAQALERLKGKAILPFHTHVNPTVCHMGVGVTPFLGFNKLYLFGVDMGYKDPDYHHSIDSSYNDLTDKYKKDFTPTRSGSINVESNFGGDDMLTNNDYVTYRVFLEGIIGLNKGLLLDRFECFNCSDGALIKGATPLQSRDFLDESPVLDKQNIIDKVMGDYFDHDICNEIYPILDSLLDEDVAIVKRACVEMSKFFDIEADSFDQADQLLTDAVKVLFHSDELFSDDKAYLLTVFSGSLLYLFTIMVRILYFRVENEEMNLQAANTGFKIIKEFFDTVAIDFEENCRKNDSMSFYGGFFEKEKN